MAQNVDVYIILFNIYKQLVWGIIHALNLFSYFIRYQFHNKKRWWLGWCLLTVIKRSLSKFFIYSFFSFQMNTGISVLMFSVKFHLNDMYTLSTTKTMYVICFCHRNLLCNFIYYLLLFLYIFCDLDIFFYFFSNILFNVFFFYIFCWFIFFLHFVWI